MIAFLLKSVVKHLSCVHSLNCGLNRGLNRGSERIYLHIQLIVRTSNSLFNSPLEPVDIANSDHIAVSSLWVCLSVLNVNGVQTGGYLIQCRPVPGSPGHLSTSPERNSSHSGYSRLRRSTRRSKRRSRHMEAVLGVHVVNQIFRAK